MALTLPWLTAAAVTALAGAGVAGAPPPSPLVHAVVSRVVNEAAASMATRRGVRLIRPLVVRLVDRSEMATAATAARAAAGDEQPTTPAPLNGSTDGSGETKGYSSRQLLYAHMGLLPPAASAPAPMPEVTGLYDLVHGRLLVANWADLAGGRFALTRDIAQALLDRRFDLGRWLAAPAGGAAAAFNLDATLARAAVLYGDATTQALEHFDPDGTIPSPRALADISDQVRTQLLSETAALPVFAVQQRLFVELDGLKFIAAIRARSPWSVVDEVWRRAPQSTEQILHPHKYERAETPHDLSAALPPRKSGDQHPAPWDVICRDTLGEWGARLFLSRHGNDYRAERAASGWGGDRALLLRPAARANPSPPDQPAASFAAWITTWDDESDAEDFAAEAAQVLADLARVPLTDARPASGRVRLMDSTGRLFALDRRHAAVGLLLAAPADAESLLASLVGATQSPQAASPSRRTERRRIGPDQMRPRPR